MPRSNSVAFIPSNPIMTDYQLCHTVPSTGRSVWDKSDLLSENQLPSVFPEGYLASFPKHLVR